VLIGLAIALEPLPLTGYILLLASDRGTRKGFGYLVGWVLSLVVVVVVTLLVTGGEPLSSGSAPSTAMLIAKILLGVVLLALAWRQHRHRGRPRKEPSWQRGLDRVGFFGAMSIGFLLQPWTLVALGAATITGADASQPATYVVLVVWLLLCTSPYLVMQVYAWRSPEASRQRLGGLRVWLNDNRDTVIVVLAVVVGGWLIAQSAYLLASA
jgi:hypothetical protein